VRGDQLARQWQLVQRLARSRAGVHVDDLAAEVGCNRRTVYRDLEALNLAGFPVMTERRDGRAFYRFIDTYRLGDVPFTADEILALAFGEDLLRTLEGTVFHDSIGSALAKIRAGLGPELADYLARLGQAFRVLPGPHKSYARFRETIRVLNEAVLARRTVRMRYRTGRTGKVASRRLDPYRVWYRSGGLYVVGLDHRSGEIRTFAVDRIRQLAATERRFRVREGFDFDAYIGGSFGVVAEPAVRVRIRFQGSAANYVEERNWHPSQSLARLPDGRLELAMQVGGTSELRAWILSFGGEAEVLEPSRLRAEVARDLAAALARYAPPAAAASPRARGRRSPAAAARRPAAPSKDGKAHQHAPGAHGRRGGEATGSASRVRAMTAGDAPAVLAIYAEGIATGHATFESQAPAWEAWDAAHLRECRLVAVDAGGVVGWAALSPISDRCAYEGVAEVSVYVAAAARGRGIGGLLLRELVLDSERAGFWTLQAGIFPENEPSLALHRRSGFRLVGRREKLGQMSGRWRDVLLVERRSPSVGIEGDA
jgi:L-amino acid N-acyltransferase YncA/predicted DNA-binding transcriptional regulator YafY